MHTSEKWVFSAQSPQGYSRFEFQGSGILAGGSLLKTTLSFQWLPVLRRRTGSLTTSTKVLVEERRL